MSQNARFQQNPDTRGTGHLRPPFEAHVADDRLATKSDDYRHPGPWLGPRVTAARVKDVAPIIRPFPSGPKH